LAVIARCTAQLYESRVAGFKQILKWQVHHDVGCRYIVQVLLCALVHDCVDSMNGFLIACQVLVDYFKLLVVFWGLSWME